MTQGPTTIDSLLRAVRSASGEADLNWGDRPSPLAGGFWAEMWRVELVGSSSLTGDLVARIMPDPVVAQREAKVQGYLASVGYPTPTVRLSGQPDADLDRAWMLMNYASGSPLLANLSGVGAIARLPRVATTLPYRLADHAARLHAIDPAALAGSVPTAEDVIIGFADRAEAIDRADLAAVAARLHQQIPSQPDAVICHGDLHPFNILSGRQGDTVLDWSTAIVADPAYDIAYTKLLLEHPPLTAPAPLRPAVKLASRTLGRTFMRRYTRLRGRPLDSATFEWFTSLHALRIVLDVGNWAANDELADRSDHPYLSMVAPAGRYLQAGTGLPVSDFRR